MRMHLYAGLAAAMTLFPALAFGQPDQAPGSEDQSSQPSSDEQPPPSDEQPPPSDEQPPPGDETVARRHHRLLTPAQEGHQGLVKGVAEAPLRDVNVIHSKVPPVLLRAMKDTYERPAPDSCHGITTQVRLLDDALGPDYDDEAIAKRHGWRGMARNGVLDGMREGEKAYIPFDGFIRFVSGASRHDQYVLAAIQAGAARRAYLKGLGEDRGCGGPGSPHHLARAIVRKEPGFDD